MYLVQRWIFCQKSDFKQYLFGLLIQYSSGAEEVGVQGMQLSAMFFADHKHGNLETHENINFYFAT